ncbi:DNA translocase FtsK [Desulfovibrio oxyclinae]|uniref:DNA translocase FtsK n=1 Tax=Desulfovibrio oxyclinae TaxID=63560 RepID=UPI000371BE5D|nr:DNA translocase FtsK [Desulfovibrio oxyclinae]
MAKAKATKANKPEGKGHGREMRGLFLLAFAAFLAVALWSFDPSDPSFNQAVTPHGVSNMAGIAGAYAAGLLVDIFGAGAWFWPLLTLYAGLSRFIRRIRIRPVQWLGVVGLYVSYLGWACHPWLFDVPENAYGFIGAGYIGREIITGFVLQWLSPAGSLICWLFLSLVSLQLVIGFSWKKLFLILAAGLAGVIEAMRERAAIQRERLQAKKLARQQAKADAEAAREAEAETADDEDDLPPFLPDPLEEPVEPKPVKEPAPEKKKKAAPAPAPKPKPRKDAGGDELPSTDLLTPPSDTRVRVDRSTLDALAERLMACLADFNVQGEVQQVVPGPVVTMFEFKPAPGIKVSKIENLTDDIALALKAMSVRIEAPIPGKDTVGIEIPNDNRETVYLREIFEAPEFEKSNSLLTLALGKDIHGEVKVADLAKMPHLLVAGATGAGKSVGINSFLLSLLYKAGPDQVKLLLVDPKRIELAPYAKLPHLVHPVVTEMNLAKSALEWAVHEMDCRYESMARMGSRNIEGYNAKLAALGDDRPEGTEALKPMPYLVIIIDELADLMMTAAKDVEQSIVRLAQLARAAGIHMVLATQRPSVDVVTGLIKANFPTRISFSVTSKFDSRTILDNVGAEKLLGRGDMLFKPSGAKLKRMHGAFVDETEIAHVVDFWERRESQEFELDFNEWGKDSGNGGSFDGADSGDQIYDEAVQFVLEQGKASISLLQRRFRIGFNRAARYIEQMEMDGLLGPQEGSRPRKVIKPE